MQGIFQKENTDKALKYGIYRHLPTYEKIIRNLVSFYIEKIEGINPRLLLCSTLIDLASIQYFLQPDLHSSQQLLCSYVKV